MSKSGTLRNDLLLVLGLCAAAIGTGFAINACRKHPLPLVYRDKYERLEEAVDRIRRAPANMVKQNRTILEQLTLQEFERYLKGSEGIVVDARPEIFHRLGHVPRALSLPRDDFENAYALLKGRLESNRSQPIVVYCADSACGDASLVRKALNGLGFYNVRVFSGGWVEWIQSGKPTEAGE